MKARSGQVALYLIAVLVAIAILVFMNVDIFLAIRAKNHATNAGDAAALAVARYQGELLNQVGKDNIAHLKAALKNDVDECAEIMERQRRRVFLDPLEGIRIGSEAAKNALSGCEAGGGDYPEQFETARMKKILQQHVFDVRGTYSARPELYPAPWEGAWEEYAQQLELAIGGEVVAGPENAEFADAYSSPPLLDQTFYNAIAGQMWCWFKWNGMWIFDCDHNNMPKPVFSASAKRDNSEIYSLHLNLKSLPTVLDEDWTNIIIRLTGYNKDDIRRSWLLTDGSQRFAFFDSRWDAWSDYPGICFNEQDFPLVGGVKPEYDVLGCAALCRVIRTGCKYDEEDETEQKRYEWTAAAKPFGTVENLEGEVDAVTCLKRIVTPAFTEVRLVPIDSVGGRDLHTADYDWMVHVTDHLMDPRLGYFASGPAHYASYDCWYCIQLYAWENPVLRQSGQRWLKYHSDDCVRSRGPGNAHGGTAHAH